MKCNREYNECQRFSYKDITITILKGYVYMSKNVAKYDHVIRTYYKYFFCLRS